MVSMLAHATGLESFTMVAIFGLGWLLGSLATAGYFKKAFRTGK